MIRTKITTYLTGSKSESKLDTKPLITTEDKNEKTIKTVTKILSDQAVETNSDKRDSLRRVIA